MKKLMIAVLFAALCAPAFAEGPRKCKGEDCPKPKGPKAEMVKEKKDKKDDRAEAFKKARKEHKKQMKATEEKMEK